MVTDLEKADVFEELHVDKEDILTPSQKEALSIIQSGANVLITGEAGTGKSFLLQRVLETRPWTAMTATTGIAANNIGGVTINSWAGLGLGKEGAEVCARKMGQDTYKRIRVAESLVIDEVSMMSAELLTLLDNVLCGVRESEKPFGGIQMIFVGDFLQLPPVSKGSPKYAFDSPSWDEAEIQTCMLREVVRQEDEEFKSILSALRVGRDHDYSALMSRIGIAPDPEDTNPPIRLYTHNAKVDAANLIALRSLEGDSVIYEADDGGHDRLVKDSRLPASLHLRVGARVMCLINAGPLYNGQLGTVLECSPDKDPKVEFDGEEYTLPKVTREVTKGFETLAVTHTESGGFVDEKGRAVDSRIVENGKVTIPRVVASRKQYPLALAYAATVHKSQGLTLPCVQVDLSKAFADGQVYTALSRCKSLDGLYISSIGDIQVNDRALEFYEGGGGGGQIGKV